MMNESFWNYVRTLILDASCDKFEKPFQEDKSLLYGSSVILPERKRKCRVIMELCRIIMTLCKKNGYRSQCNNFDKMSQCGPVRRQVSGKTCLVLFLKMMMFHSQNPGRRRPAFLQKVKSLVPIVKI